MPVLNGVAQVSFSQFGEDIIMLKMLERYSVTDITYLDIGANDPINGSNTYAFYLRGYSGVLIEPNVILYERIRKVRPGDKALNIGIGPYNQADADYYFYPPKYCGMNTFSKDEALNYKREGINYERIIKLPLRDINEVISENFKIAPTILSIDVEGLDEFILRAINFDRFQPLLVCVETVNYNKDKELTKRAPIIELLVSKGYFVYADTHVNTIFCNRTEFNKLIAAS